MSDSQRVFFSGSVGRLEGVLKNSNASNTNSAIALLFHSDPAIGGSADDQVIVSASNAFVENGVATLAINARGVGRSEGIFEQGLEELLDASIALDWFENTNIAAKNIWVVGFSEGVWPCIQLAMRRPEINRFIVISPVIKRFDHALLSSHSIINGLILQGELDSVTDKQEVTSLFSPVMKKDENAIEHIVVGKADHFFRGMQDKVHEEVTTYVKNHFSL